MEPVLESATQDVVEEPLVESEDVIEEVVEDDTQENAEPEFLTDEQMERIYATGLSDDEIMKLTEEEVSRILNPDTATPAPETKTGQTQKTSAETEPATPAVNVTEYETLKKRHDDLQTLYGKQSTELGQLRQAVTQLGQFKPLLDAVQQDKNFAAHVMNYFNSQGQTQPQNQQSSIPPENVFTDPDALTRYINENVQKGVQDELQRQQSMFLKKAQMQKQQSQIQAFHDRINAGKQQLIQNGVPLETVEAAVSKFWDAFNSGNVVDIAVKIANYEAAIKEAEERGAKTIKAKLNQVKTAPKRTVAIEATKQRSQSTSSASNLSTEAEYTDWLMTHEPTTAEYDNVLRKYTEQYG